MTIQKDYLLISFISKADTLKALSGVLKKSSIEHIYTFTQCEWQKDKYSQIFSIKGDFQGKTIIVRSSALGEDCIDCSNAGAFKSVLNVNSSDDSAIEVAVDAVVNSYKDKDSNDPNNKILIQTQTQDVVLSGTLLTRDYNGAPYYVVNYSRENTTAVTGGSYSESIKILKSDNVKIVGEFSNLILAIREIENIFSCDMPLDIEFGIKSTGDIIIFQVRPFVAAKTSLFKDKDIFSRISELKEVFRRLIKRQPHLAGDITYFGDMPDWNPAEIIGNSPHLLAASLYDEIITNQVWHQARKSQGYMDVNPAKLVVQFGNKPFVDVRSSFNSFIPETVPLEIREKLLTFYLEKLKEKPYLQDKVEFDILFTCYDLSFDKRAEELSKKGFTALEIDIIRKSLLGLTNNLLDIDSISTDIKENVELESYRQNLPKLALNSLPLDHIGRALCLLDACKEKGTMQFSRLARQGFIGKILLKSLVEEGVIDSRDYHAFLESIVTVASEFNNDINLLSWGQINKEEFIIKYGHLRPGTYDITLPRYDKSDNYFNLTGKQVQTEKIMKHEFDIDVKRDVDISGVLNRHGLTISSSNLFKFVKSALEAREYSKFLFTKSMSDAIEEIATAGKLLGFSREDLSHLDIKSIKKTKNQSSEMIKDIWQKTILKNKNNYELNCCLAFPPVLFSENDFDIVSHYNSQPNFITNKRITGEVLLLGGTHPDNLTGKIVLVESADPGYDWIFTKKPMALITKYGGPASHMAIRCAELGLPAIIGAGCTLYESLTHKSFVILDCQNQHLEFEGGDN